MDQIDHFRDNEYDFAEAALITYPRFNKLYIDILDCQELTRASGDPHCIAIEGELGVGKSTLIKSFVQCSLEEVLGSRYKPSAVYVATPEARHPAAIASAILEQLGDPFPDRGRVWSQKRRIKNYVRDLNVQTACFDDFQHLWDKKRDIPLYEESEYFKTLIKETGKTFVVTGLTGQISRILDANDQLGSLFAVRETLEPFKWDEENAAEFAMFVRLAEDKIGCPIDVPLAREAILAKIYDATEGVARSIFMLLRGSALIAHRAGHEAIHLSDLAEGYEKRLAKRFKDKKNPFK
jgi:hypothetical protein